jgi:hypothetical protein
VQQPALAQQRVCRRLAAAELPEHLQRVRAAAQPEHGRAKSPADRRHRVAIRVRRGWPLRPHRLERVVERPKSVGREDLPNEPMRARPCAKSS